MNMPTDWDIFLGDSIVILVVAVAALILLAYCLFRCCSSQEAVAAEKLLDDELDDDDVDEEMQPHRHLPRSRRHRSRRRQESTDFAYDCEAFADTDDGEDRGKIGETVAGEADSDGEFSSVEEAETNLDERRVEKAATIVRLCEPCHGVPDPTKAEFL